MPLYEFECSDCGEEFEALVLWNSGPPSCPACKSTKLEQQISLFAVDSESVRKANIQSAREKNKKVHRDKVMAEEEAIRNHED
jgi:putative FmdB family regulatory protein